MTAPHWTDCTVTLGELKPWSANPRLSTKAQAKRLIASFNKFGQVQTVAIGPDSEVYDGHQRLSALLTIHGPDYSIAARRSDRALTEDERRELVLTLHAGAVGSWDWQAVSGWDAGKLQEWGMDSNLLKDWKNDTQNLQEMLTAEVETADAEPQIDRAEELREKWGVELGQMWQLGDHRLICGDCTDAAVVERVMGGEKADMIFTDPPYGVAIGDKNRFLNSFQKAGMNLENIAGDSMGKDELFDMLVKAFSLARAAIKDSASVYVTSPQGGELGMMMMMMIETGLPVRHVLIWAKNVATFSMGRLDYEYQHEPIFFTWKKTHKFYGAGKFKTSLWFIDKPRSSKEHPTMKPVALIENGLLNSTIAGDCVYEPFSGSGTTIIACENLGRKCRAVEISPDYVAVALERMATAFPGIDIHRID